MGTTSSQAGDKEGETPEKLLEAMSIRDVQMLADKLAGKESKTFKDWCLARGIDGDGLISLWEDNEFIEACRSTLKPGQKESFLLSSLQAKVRQHFDQYVPVPPSAVEKDKDGKTKMQQNKPAYVQPGKRPAELVNCKKHGWTEHELPTHSLELVRFYHRVSANGAKPARAVPRHWFAQPRTARRFYGSRFFPLERTPVFRESCETPLSAAEREPGAVAMGLTARMLSRLLLDSLALTSRKDASQFLSNPRSAFSKRVNASSGGLHVTLANAASVSHYLVAVQPVEAYFLLPQLYLQLDKQGGCYHYSVRDHALEYRGGHEHLQQLFKSLGLAWTVEEMTKPLDASSKSTEPALACGFLIALTSIDWREVWKYGERGFRYTQLDLGHALGALRIAASLLGWELHLLRGISDNALETVLGLNLTFESASAKLAAADAKQAETSLDCEREHPALMLLALPAAQPMCLVALLLSLTSACRAKELHSPQFVSAVFEQAAKHAAQCRWLGMPNAQSETHTFWPLVHSVTAACKRAAAQSLTDASSLSVPAWTPTKYGTLQAPSRFAPLRKFLQTRRSALDFDCKSMSRSQFFQMLAAVAKTPTSSSSADSKAPVVAEPSASAGDAKAVDNTGECSEPDVVAFGVFVLRVDDLQPGFYLLVLDPKLEQQVLRQVRGAKTIERVADAPLLLHRLEFEPRVEASAAPAEPDAGAATAPAAAKPALSPTEALRAAVCARAAMTSCSQKIAQTGCFTLAMLAPVDNALRAHGLAAYRNMHWRCGELGQLLYLQACAAGFGATGLGCFLDVESAASFGLEQSALQTLYHFTVGHVDERAVPRYPSFAYESDMFDLKPSTIGLGELEYA